MFSVSGVPVKEHCVQEQERLRQECLHLQARLLAAQTECQKEREVRILHLKFCIASWISVFVNSMCLFLCICRRSSCCVSGCFRVELSYSSRQTSALVWDLRRAVFCGAAPPERTQSHTGWLMWVILTALPVFLVYKEHTVFSQCVFIPEFTYIVCASVLFHAYGDAGEAPAIFGTSNPNSGELCQISGWWSENSDWGPQLPGAPVCAWSSWNHNQWVKCFGRHMCDLHSATYLKYIKIKICRTLL